MQLFTVGLNYQTAPLAIREKVAFRGEALRAALGAVVRARPAEETAILSTCNRTELYCAAGEPTEALAWLVGYQSLDPQDLRPYLYTLPRERSGAPRVPRRLRPRLDGARRAADPRPDEGRGAPRRGGGHARRHAARLFQRSFAVAKEVRTNTGIGASVVSMAAAAVKLAGRIFPRSARPSVLLIGAGEMIELCRDALRGAAAARDHGREPHARARAAPRAPVQRPGDRAARAARAPARARHRGLLHGELAADPRQGDWSSARSRRAATGRCSWSTSRCRATSSRRSASSTTSILYTVDDLGEIVRADLDERASHVAQAEAIIDTPGRPFMHWMADARSCPTIRRAARQRPRPRASTSSNGRCACSPAATTRRRCSKRCRTASPTSCCTRRPRR